MENTSNTVQQKNQFDKRQEKENRLRVEQNKRRLKKILKRLLYLLIILFGLFGLYKLATRPRAPTPGEFFKAQSRDHIQPGTPHEAYNSNPPSGGWHYPQPADTGIYGRQLPDEQLIHNLEHGHVWIAYKPDVSRDQIETLAKIALSYGSKIVMEPRTANDSPIALVAWEHVLKLNTVDEQQIRTFIDALRGYGPENVPDYGFKDYRSQK